MIDEAIIRICGRELYLFIPMQFESVIRLLCENLTATVSVRKQRGFGTEQIEAYSLIKREEGFEILTYTGLCGIIQPILNSMNVPYKACERVIRRDKSVIDYRLKHTMLMKPLVLPRFHEIAHSLREWQLEAFKLFVNLRTGCARVATGGGKSYLVARFCWAASDSRICVTTTEVPDLRVLYNDILAIGCDVALVQGPLKGFEKDARVLCVTTQSIHHVQDVMFDVLFGDEIQKMAANTYRKGLSVVYSRRTFGLSATVGKRADKADLLVTAQFGPIVVERSYQENQAAGDVVPIYYRFIHTSCIKPKVKLFNATVRQRWLIVRNHQRNSEIADIAKYYLELGHQVLIMTTTVEHTLRLTALLPDAVGVYRSVTEKVKLQLQKEHLWRDRFRLAYSDKQMDAAVNDFAEGKQRLAVANRVWWKAKNFPQLTVLIRADAQNTDEACIQIVGRLSRKSPETGKTYGLVVDCSDGFDNTTSRNAKTRENKYKKLGWKSWEELQGPKQDLLF